MARVFGLNAAGVRDLRTVVRNDRGVGSLPEEHRPTISTGGGGDVVFATFHSFELVGYAESGFETVTLTVRKDADSEPEDESFDFRLNTPASSVRNTINLLLSRAGIVASLKASSGPLSSGALVIESTKPVGLRLDRVDDGNTFFPGPAEVQLTVGSGLASPGEEAS
ncbi:MAG: hypothetical protein AAF532_02155 [Planctomycetota bacterium]